MYTNLKSTEEITFKCKLHDKVAQAFCTEETCQERILCYICIRSSHPHNEDKFQNIVELFKFKKPISEPSPKDNEKFAQEFKANTLSLDRVYKRVKKEFVWFDYLAKIVQANSSSLKPKIDSVVTIKIGLESLIARSIDKKTISDGPELSQLIYRYLQAVSDNPAENDKVLVRQIKIQKLLEELIVQLNDLTNDLACFNDPKVVKDEVWRNRKHGKTALSEINQTNVTNPVEVVSSANESASEKLKNTPSTSNNPFPLQRPGDLSQRFETLQKLFPHQSNSATRGSDGNPSMQNANITQSTARIPLTNVLQMPLSSQPNISTSIQKMPLQPAEKPPVIVIQENDSYPTTEPLPVIKSSKVLNKPDYNVLKTPSQAGDGETLKQEIKTFFESKSKATIYVFEDWLQRAEKINLDSQLRFNLQRQEVIIQAYHKTRKQFDISILTKETDKFLNDLSTKIIKPSLRDFEENLNKRRQIFIEEERNWLDQGKIEGLLLLMKDSRVEFSQQEEELRSRLKYFNLYWKEIETKIDLKQVQKIEFAELEQIIQNLWVYRVKFPLMEKLLEKYFDCKLFQVSMKYFLMRYKQLETERFRLFEQRTDQKQLENIVEQLKEIPYSIAQTLKKRALELSEKIDFGTESLWFVKITEDTEKTKKSLEDTLKLNNLEMYNPTTLQMLVISAMHSFFFKEMIHLRGLYLKLEPVKGSEIRVDSDEFKNITPTSQGITMSSNTQTPQSNPVIESQINHPHSYQSQMLPQTQLPPRDKMVEEPKLQTQKLTQNQGNLTQMLQNQASLRDKMIEEPQQQPQKPLQSQNIVSQKTATDLLSIAANSWLRDVCKYVALLLEKNSITKKAQEICQLIAKFEGGVDVSASLCLLCSTSTPDLLKYSINKDNYILEALLQRGLKLQPPLSSDIQRFIVYLNTISWQVQTNDVLKKSTQTLEQLEACLASLQQRQLDITVNRQAQVMQERIIKFKELKNKVQSIQNIDLRKVIQDSSFVSFVSTLETLEKTYKQLCIEDQEVLRAIEANLMLFRQGEKISKSSVSPQKYKLQDLEQFNAWTSSFFKPDEAPPTFILSLTQVVGQARKDQAELEQNAVLNLTNLSEILSDFLQNTVTRQNFVDKITEINAKLNEFKNRLNNLSIELDKDYFNELNNQIAGLSEIPFQGGLKLKKNELLKFISLLESSSTSAVKCLLYWTIISTAMLRVKKFSMKFYEKFIRLTESLLKQQIIQANTPLYQTLITEFCRIKSLNSELILVKGIINAKKTAKAAASKQIFVPIRAEYLNGLYKRIKKGRLASRKLFKRINSLLKRSRRHEAMFEALVQKHKNGERVSQDEFNKFVRTVDKSISVSKKLDSKIEDTFQKRKSLEKELLELKTEELLPDILFQRMRQFCEISYAEYPIISKKCEGFLKDFVAYQSVYELYKTLEGNQESATMNQLLAFERQLEEFESNISKSKSYNFAPIKMKEGIRKLKVLLIERVISKGLSNVIQITLEDVKKLIQEFSGLNSEQEGLKIQEVEFLNTLSEKINAAIAEIKQANSNYQLEAANKKALEEFKGNVNLTSVYDLKKRELSQAESANPGILLKPIPLNLSFRAEPINIPIETNHNSLVGGMDIEPQSPGDSSNMLLPIRLEELKFENLLPKKHAEAQQTVIPPKVSPKTKQPVPVMSGDVVIIIEPSDSKEPLQNKEVDGGRDNSENFEPPLTKKVKDNEGNEILTEPTRPEELEEDKAALLKEKLNKLVYREGVHRSPRKDIGKHLCEIAAVIQEEIENDTQKEEQHWLDLWSQLVAEVDSLKYLWKLLDEEFDKSLFRRILHMTPEQRKEFDKKAYEEIEKNRMYNASAKTIISRLLQPVKLARKSFFGS